MPLPREVLERQLQEAQARLSAWENQLNEKGVEEAARKKDPRWRSLNSQCADIQGRIERVSEKEKQAADLAARKASAE